jgi:hypothetical protein
MGFFKFEKFNNTYEWSSDTVNGSFISILDNDFDYIQEDITKQNTISLLFNTEYVFQETVITKKYYTPIFYTFKDVYGKDINYDILRLTYMYNGIEHDVKKPEDFIFSFGIKVNDTVIREWFLPLTNSTYYSYIDLDLQPIFSLSKSFDEVFIRVLRSPSNSKLYLGSLYLVQDSDEIHNIKLALSDMLHLKYKKPFTALHNDINTGDDTIYLANNSDIFKGTTIMLGEGDLTEVHVVKQVDPISNDVASVKLMDEFDLKSVMYPWAAGTTVYKVFPSSITEMRDADAIFPLYFIYAETFINNESAMSSGVIRDNYVRDHVANTEHMVAVRRAWDSVTTRVSVNVFSDTVETALDMWRFLKAYVTNRDVLVVAGKPIQYVVESERDIAPDDTESLPNYIMDLTFYYSNNVYIREYVRYPKFPKMAVFYEIKSVEVIK